MLRTLAGCLLLPAAAVALRVGAVENSTTYYWSSGHGNVGQYGTSQYSVVEDLRRSFSWSWEQPAGKKRTLPYGVVLDDDKNLYITSATAIWKVGLDAQESWSFHPNPPAPIFSSACLHAGRVHFTTLDGKIWAVDMETGKLIWSTKVAERIDLDNGFVSAHNGVVVASTDADPRGSMKGNAFVTAVKADTGESLWRYRPMAYLWNFLPSFTDQNTLLYQDYEGRAYHQRLLDGEVLWMEGGRPGSWSDGSPLLHDGVFYTVAGPSHQLFKKAKENTGTISARSLATGDVMWEQSLPMPPGTPAIGHLPKTKGLTLIVPVGVKGSEKETRSGKSAIVAFNATTGDKKWTWNAPSQTGEYEVPVLTGFIKPRKPNRPPTLVTNPWSPPVIDSAGTLFIGHASGTFYSIKDRDGNGHIDPKETSMFKTGAPFAGCSSPALGPGFLAVASTDKVYIFRNPGPGSRPAKTAFPVPGSPTAALLVTGKLPQKVAHPKKQELKPPPGWKPPVNQTALKLKREEDTKALLTGSWMFTTHAPALVKAAAAPAKQAVPAPAAPAVWPALSWPVPPAAPAVAPAAAPKMPLNPFFAAAQKPVAAAAPKSAMKFNLFRPTPPMPPMPPPAAPKATAMTSWHLLPPVPPQKPAAASASPQKPTVPKQQWGLIPGFPR